MSKKSNHKPTNQGNTVEIKINRTCNAAASAFQKVYVSDTQEKLSKTSLINQDVVGIQPDELPTGESLQFAIAGIIKSSPNISGEDKMANIKVTNEWKEERLMWRKFLCPHTWSRVCDRGNLIHCADELDVNSALILGSIASIVRRKLKVEGITTFNITKPSVEILKEIDMITINLFEVYSFDTSLMEGKAKFYVLNFNFRMGTGTCSNMGEISIEEILNEYDYSLTDMEFIHNRERAR